MSIALESNTSNRIEQSGFVRGMSFKVIYDYLDSGRFAGDQRSPALNSTPIVKERADEDNIDSSSSSSIGRNSDSRSSDGDGDSGDGEVQSSYKGPLSTLDSLEEVLPIKRGISTFYSGKSKSFTSLADVSSCSSIKDIAKPEDAYTRKRKNLIASSNFWDKNRNHASENNGGGLSKRLNSSRSSMALTTENNSGGFATNSSSPSLCLPPLPPNGGRSSNNESSASLPTHIRNFSPWRSFSLSDLQHAAAATPTRTRTRTPSKLCSVINNRDVEENSD